MTDLEQQISHLDRKLGAAYREFHDHIGSIPKTAQDRAQYPAKMKALSRDMDALEAKRLALSDELTASIGT